MSDGVFASAQRFMDGQDSMSPTLYMIAWPCLFIFCVCIHALLFDCLKENITTLLSHVDCLNRYRYLLKLLEEVITKFMLVFYLIVVKEYLHAFMRNRWAQIGAVLCYIHIFLVYMVGPFILQPMYYTIDKWRRRIQVTKNMYKRARAFVANEFTDYVDAKCNICVENRKDVVLIPCGHTVCHVCVDKMDTCPQCRCGIDQVQDMYID